MYSKFMVNLSAFLILLTVVILLGVGCNAEQVIEPVDTAMLEKQAMFVEDMAALIKTVEASHPAFVVDDLPANYEKEKSIILEEVKKTTDQTDFRFLVRRYLTLLRDSHTQVRYPESQ